ncbi:alpha/beta fold hydrolase [Streptomyces sp. NPDC012746]
MPAGASSLDALSGPLPHTRLPTSSGARVTASGVGRASQFIGRWRRLRSRPWCPGGRLALGGELVVRHTARGGAALPLRRAPRRRLLSLICGPVTLVGHSYGGVVITEAGNHPKVNALVYIAAFAPDKGESVSTLVADPPPGAPVPPILPPNQGFLFLDRDKSPSPSPVTCPSRRPDSWPTRRSPGAWTPWAARSPSPPGAPSAPGT